MFLISACESLAQFLQSLITDLMELRMRLIHSSIRARKKAVTHIDTLITRLAIKHERLEDKLIKE